MQQLEPRKDPPDWVFYNELDEILAIFFIENGTFDVGFEINSEQHFVLRYQNSSYSPKSHHLKEMQKAASFGEPIGQYGCVYNKPSRFIYKSFTSVSGYFIRKKNWNDLIGRNAFVGRQMNKQIGLRHMRVVQIMNKYKRVEILKKKALMHVDEYKFV